MKLSQLVEAPIDGPPHKKIWQGDERRGGHAASREPQPRSLWVQLYHEKDLDKTMATSAIPSGTRTKVTLIDKGDWKYQHRVDIPFDAIDDVIKALQHAKTELKN